MMNGRNAYFHEYMGREVEVVSSSNATMAGMKGIVADESKRTITIRTGTSSKIIPKSACNLLISGKDGSFAVNGKYICLRPEDRLKEHRKIEKMIRNGEKYD